MAGYFFLNSLKRLGMWYLANTLEQAMEREPKAFPTGFARALRIFDSVHPLR